MFGSVQLQQKSFGIGCFLMEKMSRNFSDAVVMQLSHIVTGSYFDRGIMLAQSCSQDVEDPAYKKPSDCKSIPLFQKLSMTKALVWPLRWPFQGTRGFQWSRVVSAPREFSKLRKGSIPNLWTILKHFPRTAELPVKYGWNCRSCNLLF